MFMTQLHATLTSFALAFRDNQIPDRFSTYVRGSSGIGKTETIKQVGTDLDMAVVVVHVAQLEPGELLGIPRSQIIRPGVTVQRYDLPGYLPHYLCDENGKIITRTIDGKERKVIDIELLGSKVKNRRELQRKHGNNWIDKVKGVILLLDEINRVQNQETKQAIFELPGDYSLHEYEVPEHCMIIAAGNPSTPKYQVNTMERDKAWSGRFLHLNAEGRFEDSLAYFSSRKFDPSILSYLNAQKDALMEEEPSELFLPERTPRSWNRLNTIIKYIDLPNDPEILKEVYAGAVGEVGLTFAAHVLNGMNEAPSALSILTDYPSHRAKILSKIRQEEWGYIHQIVRYLDHFLADEERIRPIFYRAADESDVNKHLENDIIIHPGEMVPHPLHLQNIEEFLMDLPAEIRMAFIKKVIYYPAVNEVLGTSDLLFSALEDASNEAGKDC